MNREPDEIAEFSWELYKVNKIYSVYLLYSPSTNEIRKSLKILRANN